MKKIISLVIIAAMLVSLLPCFAITIAADTTANTAITPDTSWYDGDTTNATANTFEIDSAAKLLGFAKLMSENKRAFVGDTVKLTADIDLNPGWDANNFTEAPANVWPQIEQDQGGIFDGQGHTVKGVYQVSDTANFAGIFGRNYGRAAEIKNVRFENCYSESSVGEGHGFFFGAITSNADVKIDNVYVDARIKNTAETGAADGIGGLIGGMPWGGSAPKLSMSNTVFAGSIEINPTKADGYMVVGGLVGTINTTNPVALTNCASYATFKGSSPAGAVTLVGGFVGCYAAVSYTLEIITSVSSCAYQITDATPTGTRSGLTYGSFVASTRYNNGCAMVKTTNILYTSDKPVVACGWILRGPLADVYTADTQTEKKEYDGILVAESTSAMVEVSALTGSAAEATITAKGFADWSAVENGLMLPTVIVEGSTGSGDEEEEEIPLEIEVPEEADVSWYSSKLNVYTLEDAADLLGFAYIVAAYNDFFAGKTIKLAADIDLNPGWDAGAEEVEIPDNIWPVCNNSQDRFAGVFDGQGHSISGIYLYSGVERAGIFGTTGDGTVAIVKNLKILNSYIESDHDGVGSIFGSSFAACTVVISNVYSEARVICNATKGGGLGIGGLIGGSTWNSKDVFNLTIEDSVFAGEVTSSFVENTQGNNGEATGANIGGILGAMNSKSVADGATLVNITNCAFYGKLLGVMPMDGNVGGLIGVNRQHMKVENCISAGSIEITTATFGSIGSVFGLLTGSAVTSLKNNLYTGDFLGSDVYIPAENDLLIQILDTADLKGSAAAALLTEKGLTEWSVTEAGYPLPTTVKDMIGNVEVPAYEPGVGVVISDEPTNPGEGEGEGDGAGDGEGEGDQTETQAPAPETQAPTTTTAPSEEESGCASVVFDGLVMTLMIAGAAVTVVKKRK